MVKIIGRVMNVVSNPTLLRMMLFDESPAALIEDGDRLLIADDGSLLDLDASSKHLLLQVAEAPSAGDNLLISATDSLLISASDFLDIA